MNFDIGKLLTSIYKDVRTTHALLASYGYDVEMSTVYQWFYRRALPSKWILILLSLREIETGTPVSLAPYLK